MPQPTHAVGLNQVGRDFVVGDVHGCFRTLEVALLEIEFDPIRDRLFGVGDLVNRGPHSADALKWLEERFAAVTMGNHERPIMAWFRAKLLKGRPRLLPWLREIDPGDYQRWFDAIGAMPFALSIETHYGLVGVVHAQSPNQEWSRAIERLESGSNVAIDIALLGHESKAEEERVRARPVEGLRALVHGHWPVKEVETVHNRWNIDTGAGIGPRQRLSILKVNAAEISGWTFDVDECR